MRLLRILCLLISLTASAVASNQVDLEDELMRETIAAGRGERDDIGVRDQWSSSEHLRETSRFDTRRPISTKVRRLLQKYRLTCDDCSQNEATAMINAFVLESKRSARYKEWTNRVVLLVVALGAIVFIMKMIAADTTERRGVNDQMSKEIDDQRRQAAMEEKQQLATANAKHVPTWRDNEEKEVWTLKQQKQFLKALIEFGGISPKERYNLISGRIKADGGKTRLECLMHHKLQQAIAKDQ